MPNSGEYKSRVGLKDLYYALVSQDDANGYAAETPAYLAPAAEASQTPANNTVVQYADDIPYDTQNAEGATVVNLTVTGVPNEVLATLLGRVFDSASGRVWDNTKAVAPYVAIGFRSKKSNGSYRYYWYLKGTFAPPSEEHKSESDTPDPKTTQLVFTAINTIYDFDLGSFNDDLKRVYGDEDTANFDATGWFLQVQTPATTTPSALALSSSNPTDEDTGVAVDISPTLTFNNALPDGAIYNVALIDPADGSVKASAISLDATKKIITINPTSNLDTSTDYIIAYALVDVYGQSLSGAVNFTTTA